MVVLVINCGSTSVKVAVVQAHDGSVLTVGGVEGVGGAGRLLVNGEVTAITTADHGEALSQALPAVLGAVDSGKIQAVGHRVVHGGEAFARSVRIDEAVETAIEELIGIAPLHNPANLAGIRSARSLLPELPHVAVFDTAFHGKLPPRARNYALPTELAEKHGVRRYGFHGTSHQFVAERGAAFLGEELSSLRVISCHLGGGCSVAAIEFGRSVETSMGMTPLEGLVMATRAGDIDPGAVLYLMGAAGLSAEQTDAMLNRESGLKGLTGTGDMREIEEQAAAGDERCRGAINLFCHRIRKYIGAYAAVMGGVDLLVFTGGIGENSALIRHRVCQRLEFLGARIDEDANRTVSLQPEAPVGVFSQAHSRVRMLAVRTDEQWAIAKETEQVIGDHGAVKGDRPIPIAISARHIHLTQEAVEALFGPGHRLTPRNPLSQPGQFACEEVLTVVGPKRNIPKVRVLGPVRPKCQVEVSRTDEFWLGIDAPIRRSGDVANTPGVTLEGPAGSLTIEDGVICAWRHIHMTPEDAEHYGVQHKDIVEVAVNSEGRDLVFGDVMVRVSPKYALEMHVDTDEANAAEINSGDPGLLVPTNATATLRFKGRA
jgi:acetate kinase